MVRMDVLETWATLDPQEIMKMRPPVREGFLDHLALPGKQGLQGLQVWDFQDHQEAEGHPESQDTRARGALMV